MKEKETLFRKVEKSEGVADAFYIHHLGFVKPVTGYFFTEEEMAEHDKRVLRLDQESRKAATPPHQVNSEK